MIYTSYTALHHVDIEMYHAIVSKHEVWVRRPRIFTYFPFSCQKKKALIELLLAKSTWRPEVSTEHTLEGKSASSDFGLARNSNLVRRRHANSRKTFYIHAAGLCQHTHCIFHDVFWGYSFNFFHRVGWHIESRRLGFINHQQLVILLIGYMRTLNSL